MLEAGSVRRVAVVTGAASGIGLEIARQFERVGHRVVYLDIDKDALRANAAGQDSLAIACDVTQDASITEAFAQIADKAGTADILVNCAGWGINMPFLELSAADAQRIVDINFFGVVRVTRAALPGMVKNKWGRIVSVSSDAARVGTPREAVYSGAKAAVIGFSKSLCAEVARDGITVNVICPGTTDTPLLHGVLTPEQIARRRAANPSGRIAEPGDVGGAALYFASEQASFVNGQVLSVSGGITRVG